MSLIVRLEGLAKLGARVGVLTCCGRIPQEYSCTLQKDLTMEAVRYAASLYASLQDMDAAGVDHILIELPPTGDSWDAIHDRLRRAAAV
jgi:L-threonylcarbamoyladenylate synthase